MKHFLPIKGILHKGHKSKGRPLKKPLDQLLRDKFDQEEEEKRWGFLKSFFLKNLILFCPQITTPSTDRDFFGFF